MKFQIASLSIFLGALVSQATADMEIVEFRSWQSLTVCTGIGQQVGTGKHTDGVVSVSSISLSNTFFTITNFCGESEVDFYKADNGTYWKAFRQGIWPPEQLATCVPQDPQEIWAVPAGPGSTVKYSPKVACIGRLCQ
jgi:hypothetical protein